MAFTPQYMRRGASRANPWSRTMLGYTIAAGIIARSATETIRSFFQCVYPSLVFLGSSNMGFSFFTRGLVWRTCLCVAPEEVTGMRRLRPAVKRCGVACMQNFILPQDREESLKMEAAIVSF